MQRGGQGYNAPLIPARFMAITKGDLAAVFFSVRKCMFSGFAPYHSLRKRHTLQEVWVVIGNDQANDENSQHLRNVMDDPMFTY